MTNLRAKPYVDYSIIKKNPKILCGYSDITALQNAFLTKTGLVTYYGPHFSTFGMQKGFEYTLEYFKNCLFSSTPYEIASSKEWSNDEWYMNQEKRVFIVNEGSTSISYGIVGGKIVGGNLCTLNLLQGTEFMPSLKNTVLFIEDDSDTNAVKFDRDLQSLIHQPDFNKVQGLVIGRFEKSSGLSSAYLQKILATKKELSNIPIIINADFGHTSPMATFPIGGQAIIKAEKGKSPVIEIIVH